MLLLLLLRTYFFLFDDVIGFWEIEFFSSFFSFRFSLSLSLLSLLSLSSFPLSLSLFRYIYSLYIFYVIRACVLCRRLRDSIFAKSLIKNV